MPDDMIALKPALARKKIAQLTQIRNEVEELKSKIGNNTLEYGNACTSLGPAVIIVRNYNGLTQAAVNYHCGLMDKIIAYLQVSVDALEENDTNMAAQMEGFGG